MYDAMVAQSSVVVRKLGVDRGGELSVHRALSSPQVTPDETLHCLSRRTAQAAVGRRIVAAQDTTEVNFAGRQWRGPAPGWGRTAAAQCQGPAARPGDRGRDARVALRCGTVVLGHPRHGRRDGDAERIVVTLVEAIEADPPAGAVPLPWRLLTTLPAQSEAEAAEIVRFYRLRWRIEQTFRMLKSHGLQIKQTQTAEPHRLFNLAALAIGAAVCIIQLVDACDGSARPASEAQIAAAVALCPKLEGKAERQRNHHPAGSLAWMSWLIARLGGWNCYYKPPRPKTMRHGWQRFAAIA